MEIMLTRSIYHPLRLQECPSEKGLHTLIESVYLMGLKREES